jgi:hypothetical protein
MHARSALASETGRGPVDPAIVCRFARAAGNAQPNSPARTARLLLLRLRQNDGTEALLEIVRTAEIRKSLVGYIVPQTHAYARGCACARETCVSHEPALPFAAGTESSFHDAGDAERRRVLEAQTKRHGVASKPGARFVLRVGFTETFL